MQPTEAPSIVRRALDIEDYIDIVRRHKGWIFGPFLFTLAASVVGVFLWPDSYRSEALVEIKPQQLPQNLVKASVVQDMTDRINSMSNQILSRTSLTTIIRNFDLYQRELARQPIEDVIELMRGKIGIQPVQTVAGAGRTVSAFRVSFAYDNRYEAQRVVQDLVSRFMDENIRSRNNITFQATEFLQDQSDLAKKELDEIEDRLTVFRMSNNGRLPDQLQGNMSQLNAAQNNTTYLSNAISRASSEKMGLETNLRIYRDNISSLSQEVEVAPAPAKVKSPRLLQAEQEVASLERSLSQYLQKYTDSHPDVLTVRQQLNGAKERLADAQAEDAAQPAPAVVVPPQRAQAERDIRAREDEIQRLESQIHAKDLEIAGYEKQMQTANQQVAALQGRIQSVPIGEQEFDDLLRQRALANDKYIEMTEKLQQAVVAQEMEGREQGETLAVLDAASLPINPTEPQRGFVISIGAAMGLMFGLVIAGARELKDTSLKNLKDVRAYTNMAILGSVPLLENDFVVRRRKRISWLGWTTACLFAAMVMGGSVVYYYATKV